MFPTPLDEPSLGLAPALIETTFRIIREIRQRGVTVLMVEQNAYVALRMADRGYVMETGQIALGACRRNAPTPISGGTKRIGPSEIVDPEPDARSHFRSQWCQTDYSDTLLEGPAGDLIENAHVKRAYLGG